MEKKPVKVNADSPASPAKTIWQDVIIVFLITGIEYYYRDHKSYNYDLVVI